LRDQHALAVEHALDVGEQDQLLGVQRLRDRSGRLVGVHVVRDAVVVDADRRDHRHVARVRHRGDRRGIDAAHLADAPEVAVGVGAARDADHVAVVAREPDRAAARLLDQRDDLAVHRAAEHHLDHVHSSRRR
jgi:hypothetical protein